ncbi:response regulator [Variovorax ginsengisoli]|uniref:Response regulator transcription factor n=1 Tax=Variovorax ginsengisoli TaxID=363844 RepID=A0ABT8S4T4_9BURK|nr:response regulator transcription factor [Variovorax ginsengisoli]MDN8614751.1 response regulator transcription factor [Variovorax ginsengisoli]MDO1533921.1 response regulator transcription factor [Variovorax ginsengisoli]
MLPARILLIDDHALFRCGLRMVLASGIPELEVAEASSLEEGLRAGMDDPALVLLDIQLHGLNGLEGIALVKRKWPEAVVVILSSDAGPHNVRMALERGAAAFVSKADSADNILAVIERLRRGEPAGAAAQAAAGEGAGSPQLLTPRQFEVLDLLCQGLPNKVIGRRLGLSENTVRGHVQAVLAALQVSSRSEAGFAARRRGLVG